MSRALEQGQSRTGLGNTTQPKRTELNHQRYPSTCQLVVHPCHPHSFQLLACHFHPNECGLPPTKSPTMSAGSLITHHHDWRYLCSCQRPTPVACHFSPYRTSSSTSYHIARNIIIRPNHRLRCCTPITGSPIGTKRR